VGGQSLPAMENGAISNNMARNPRSNIIKELNRTRLHGSSQTVVFRIAAGGE
jgi:hypothetical protein